MRIRRGDQVVVITGDEAGSTPHQVLQVLDRGKRLIVEGVNRVYKHVRRGHPKSPQGGRLELEMPIDASNCLVYCSACDRGVRVGFRYLDDGSKERCCRRCGGALGTAGSAKAAYAKKT